MKNRFQTTYTFSQRSSSIFLRSTLVSNIRIISEKKEKKAKTLLKAQRNQYLFFPNTNHSRLRALTKIPLRPIILEINRILVCFTSEESLEINDIPDIKRITRQRKNLSLSRECSAETSSTSSKFTGPGEEEEDVGESSGLLPTLDAVSRRPRPTSATREEEKRQWCTRTSKYRGDTICTRRPSADRAQNVWTTSNRRVKYREYSIRRGDELTRVWNFRVNGRRDLPRFMVHAVFSHSLSLSPRVFRFYRGSRVGRFEWLIDNVLILKGVCYWKRCEVMWRDVFLKNRSKIFIEIRCLFFESVLYWKVIENRKRFFGYSRII